MFVLIMCLVIKAFMGWQLYTYAMWFCKQKTSDFGVKSRRVTRGCVKHKHFAGCQCTM